MFGYKKKYVLLTMFMLNQQNLNCFLYFLVNENLAHYSFKTFITVVVW